MTSVFLFLAWAYQDPKDIIYLREQVKIELAGGIEETYDREYYFDKKVLRVDELGLKRSYVISQPLERIVILNHENRKFSWGNIEPDGDLIRTMLRGMGHLVDGQLQQRARTLSPTGLKRKISYWNCQEFKINYPSRFGLDTKIWCTNEKTIMSKNDMKMLWYTIIGGSPTQDVNRVITQFFKDIPGIPIQFVSTIKQQESTVTITSRIVTIEKRKIKDENLFKIPKNYRVIIPSARNN